MASAVAAPIRELPPEIWKLILSNLEESQLMTCRFVNRGWRDLANEVLRETSSLWKPSFKSVGQVASGRCGTRFWTADDVTRFMEEMEGIPNPFPNGTVICMHAWGLKADENIAFLNNFCQLVDVFKEFIFNLVYDANEMGEITGQMDLKNWFRGILSLKKLRTLVIVANLNWEEDFGFLRSVRSQELFKEMLEENQVTFPEELKELRVEGVGGVLPLAYMFQGSESVLKSVSCLELLNNNGCIFPIDPKKVLDFSMIMDHFPSLEKLKVRYANAEFLQMFQQFKPKCLPSLKEVSLHFEDDEISEIELNIKKTFELLDFHAATLELLNLEFGDTYLEAEGVASDILGRFSSVKYTKLKTLVFQYGRINPFENWPVGISELMAKLENLQEFKIIQPHAEKSSPRKSYKKVVAYWGLLPATVKVIHVPIYGWKIKRGESRQFDY